MKSLEFEEFMRAAEEVSKIEGTLNRQYQEEQNGEIEVQRAVVEELAEEKVKLQEEISVLSSSNEELKRKIEELEKKFKEKEEEENKLKEELSKAKTIFEEEVKKSGELSKAIEDKERKISQLEESVQNVQERNPNALALLDRDVDIPDRFPGEARDHVIEAIEEAWKKADEEGRVRKAQVLEGVLASNERNGLLEKRREWLDKLLSESFNIIDGNVIEELESIGISYKNGEEYLTVQQIKDRNF